jgi:hypothetical protein
MYGRRARPSSKSPGSDRSNITYVDPKDDPSRHGEELNAKAARAFELRVIVRARSAGDAFDLRCELREKLIDFLHRELPNAPLRTRCDIVSVPPVFPDQSRAGALGRHSIQQR